MKDRIMIIGVIVAIHVIVISLFIFTGDDSSTEDSVYNTPDTEESIDIPDSALNDSSELDLDMTDEQLRDDMVNKLTAGAENNQTYIVEKGDSLMVISKKFYGSSRHYNYIFEANKDTLKSPSSVRIGQKLIIPPAP